jgi:hypothetical protein
MSDIPPPDLNDAVGEASSADAQLPVAIGNYQLPLPFAIRSMALSIAGRYIGDVAVKDASYYQALKLDNKLGPSADLQLLLHYAMNLERYLWGQWSKDIAGEAMEKTLDELDAAVKAGEFDEEIAKAASGEDDNPNRPVGA